MIAQSEFNTIAYVLFLRFKITLRFLRELGWIRTVLVGVSLVMFFMPVFSLLGSSEGMLYLSALYLALVTGIHFNRKDHFLIQSLGVSKPKVFGVEYGIIAIPFLILAGYLGLWFIMIILIPGCLIIAHMPVSTRSFSSNKRRLQCPFYLPIEWISGLRRQKWGVVTLLVLGVIAGWWKLFGGWLFIFLLTIVAVTFYRYCESKQFILLSDRSPALFVGNKMLKGALYYVLATGILWVELFIIYPERTFYSLLFLGVNLALLLLVIAGKYAFYQEHKNIEVMTAVIFCIGSMCLFVSYFIPAFFMLLIWLVWRGMKRLRERVYAFH